MTTRSAPELDPATVPGWRRVPARPGSVVESDLDGFPVHLEDVDAEELLELAEQAELQTRAAERRRLRYAYRWCVLNPATEDSGAASWAEAGRDHLGCEELTLGGDGTPLVAEGAAAQLAAALQVTTAAALQLMADALDLHHRLPRIWARVQALEVAPWRARRVAQATTGCSRAVAAEVDRLIAPMVGSCGMRRIEAAIAEAIARLEPQAQAEAEAQAEEAWGVRLSHPDPGFYDGTSRLEAFADTVDLTAFHDLVCAVAHQLGGVEPGVEPGDDLDRRKARALGVIADRAFAGVSILDPKTPVRPAARTRLYLHVDARDLPDTGETAQPAIGRIERLGPATLAKLHAWLAGTHATVLPVLRLDHVEPVDRHDPSPRMRELVTLRDPHCVFPHCSVDARAATSTTSAPTTRRDRPGRPVPTTSPRCVDATTATRPAVAGDIAATPTAATSGRLPPGAPTSSPLTPPTPSAESTAAKGRESPDRPYGALSTGPVSPLWSRLLHMSDVTVSFRRASIQFERTVRTLRLESWERPTPCEV